MAENTHHVLAPRLWQDSAREKVLPTHTQMHTMLPVRTAGTRYNGGVRKLPAGTGDDFEVLPRHLFNIFKCQTGENLKVGQRHYDDYGRGTSKEPQRNLTEPQSRAEALR